MALLRGMRSWAELGTLPPGGSGGYPALRGSDVFVFVSARPWHLHRHKEPMSEDDLCDCTTGLCDSRALVQMAFQAIADGAVNQFSDMGAQAVMAMCSSAGTNTEALSVLLEGNAALINHFPPEHWKSRVMPSHVPGCPEEPIYLHLLFVMAFFRASSASLQVC